MKIASFVILSETKNLLLSIFQKTIHGVYPERDSSVALLPQNGRKRRVQSVTFGTIVKASIVILIFSFFTGSVHFATANVSGRSAAIKTPGLKPPENFRSEPEISKGRFLVASRDMKDPRFSRSVILLTSYDSKGAMGLVINRPSKVKLSRVLPEISGILRRSDTIYSGGPVAGQQIQMLIRYSNNPENSYHLFDDVYVSSDRKVLQRMIDRKVSGEKFHVYSGYAGWAPGQLEREVLRGGWHIFHADAEIIFSKEPSEIWPELIRKTSLLWVMR